MLRRIDYIKELRKRLLIITIPSVIVFMALFFNYTSILDYLINYYGFNVVNLSPTESINAGINFSLAITALFFIPAFIVQLIEFSKEIIPQKQKQKIYTFGSLGLIFALIGFYFGVTYFSKMIFTNLTSYAIGNSFWGVSSILSTASLFGLILAFAIQGVWIIPTLAKVGLYDKEKLTKFRPIIFIGLLILSAVLTPPDILSQFIMMIPLYGSYEIGTLLTKSNKEVKNDRYE